MSNLPATTPQDLKKVREAEALALTLPQVDLMTDHTFHAGMYARTITLPIGTIITGALIKIATLLIISGHVMAYVAGETIEIEGHQVLAGSAGRKQAFVALAPSAMTMVFTTKAETVDQAEREFTDEFERLLSRKQPELNRIVITGE